MCAPRGARTQTTVRVPMRSCVLNRHIGAGSVDAKHADEQEANITFDIIKPGFKGRHDEEGP